MGEKRTDYRTKGHKVPCWNWSGLETHEISFGRKQHLPGRIQGQT